MAPITFSPQNLSIITVFRYRFGRCSRNWISNGDGEVSFSRLSSAIKDKSGYKFEDGEAGFTFFIHGGIHNRWSSGPSIGKPVLGLEPRLEGGVDALHGIGRGGVLITSSTDSSVASLAAVVDVVVIAGVVLVRDMVTVVTTIDLLDWQVQQGECVEKGVKVVKVNLVLVETSGTMWMQVAFDVFASFLTYAGNTKKNLRYISGLQPVGHLTQIMKNVGLKKWVTNPRRLKTIDIDNDDPIDLSLNLNFQKITYEELCIKFSKSNGNKIIRTNQSLPDHDSAVNHINTEKNIRKIQRKPKVEKKHALSSTYYVSRTHTIGTMSSEGSFNLIDKANKSNVLSIDFIEMKDCSNSRNNSGYIFFWTVVVWTKRGSNYHTHIFSLVTVRLIKLPDKHIAMCINYAYIIIY
ncbi:hypothetical protein AGLY_012703 [Aphis glycines]|uniref:Uncharacterized protein n=1 Tax=Aphis glycines TaxID=307491 RepID=A0A6G0T8P5_APHGL|nr:hypothetical protein AGLY_012703 [Aphis glycines]